jgi:uncharacterized repeat protein (TIGR03803 family)
MSHNMRFQKIAHALSISVRVALAAVIVVSAARPAAAQVTVTTLKSFPSPGPVHTYAPLLQATDGNFYGTTVEGGTANSGTIFRMTPAGVVTVLHSFTGVGTDGVAPRGGLIQGTDGNFYGTTSLGGFWTGGTVFRMTPAGTVTTLYSFTGGNDGSTPYATLVQANDGNFYGTTITDGGPTGGPYLGFGTIFKITPAGVLTTLHAFTGSAAGGGYFAIGPLIQASDGHLYGTTNQGGSSNLGIVFRVTLGGAFTVIHTFVGGVNDGRHPWASVVEGLDGFLYGTTSEGGSLPAGWGVAYKISKAGAFSILHRFDLFSQSANLPLATLELANDGNFYGTTFYAGFAATGRIFRMTHAGVVTFLHTFAAPGATNPYAPLAQATDGNLYGTGYAGGANNVGALYRITTGGAFTNIHSFYGSTDGARPHAPMIRGSDGNFYGTTRIGGDSNKGTVFKMTPAGAVSILHSFTDNGDGIVPTYNEYSGLVQGVDGDYYGGFGTTLYKINSAGTLTVLHTLDSATEGDTPSTLIQANDGNFYGTTRFGGGVANRGTLFRMTPAGAVTVLHVFNEGIVNDAPVFFLLGPYAALVQGSDGRLYGTTYFGGTTGNGMAFASTLAGTFTVLHNFNDSSTGSCSGPPDIPSFCNSFPHSPLIQATDGQFYGTIRRGNGSSQGKVFKMTAAGAVTIVHTFTGSASDGGEPAGALLQAPDGLFYGTTTKGGSAGRGTIFRMTSGGAVTVLHSFTGLNGVAPWAGLLRTADGKFYGTVTFGGPTFVGMTQNFGPFLEQPTGMGLLFRMSMATPFTDDPLVPGSTVIKAVHINELRTRIDAVRATYGLGAFGYTEAVTTGVVIRAQHVLEMRTAIQQAYTQAGLTPPTFTPLGTGSVVLAVHITELRDAVKALE